MNAIIASRFRTLTTRRSEILDERSRLDSTTFHLRLTHVNHEIVLQIEDSLKLVRRWSPVPMKYIHKQLVPKPRLAA